MPSYVNPDKCDGCKALDKTACQHICPNDLMVLDKRQDEGLQPGRLDVLGVLQLRQDLPHAGRRSPRLRRFRAAGRFGDADAFHGSIMWTVKFRNGTIKRFKFPIRTTPEGKAVPDGGFETKGDLDSPLLFTEPASIGHGRRIHG